MKSDLYCDDPACVICSIMEDPPSQRFLRRREITNEIRELNEFYQCHPEHAVEVFCRINELLAQLED